MIILTMCLVVDYDVTCVTHTHRHTLIRHLVLHVKHMVNNILARRPEITLVSSCMASTLWERNMLGYTISSVYVTDVLNKEQVVICETFVL